MDSHLLVTKFHIPKPRFGWVSRARLVAQLDEGLQRQHRLLLIAAPAGCGKTTLATEWVEGRNVVWLSLDEADNDPAYFFNLLIAALRQITPSIGETALQLLHLPQPSFQSLCATLINDLAGAKLDITLVFDDYHVIFEPAIHQAMGILIERLPSSIPVVITVLRL